RRSSGAVQVPTLVDTPGSRRVLARTTPRPGYPEPESSPCFGGIPLSGSVRVLAFDLDDTLAISKSRIDPRMTALLARLLDRVEVCIISGGRFEQFDAQVLRHLDLSPHQRERLHLMPTCGTRYYRWVDDGWHEVYAENLDEADRRRVIAT